MVRNSNRHFILSSVPGQLVGTNTVAYYCRTPNSIFDEEAYGGHVRVCINDIATFSHVVQRLTTMIVLATPSSKGK